MGDKTGYIGEMDRYRKKKTIPFDESEDLALAYFGDERNQYLSTRQDIYSLGAMVLDLLLTIFKEPEFQN